MRVYHGTSKTNLNSMLSEGVQGPSYWGSFEIATEYASHFGDEGVILSVYIEDHEFKANMLLQESINENEGAEETLVLEEDDAMASLRKLDSIICQDTIFEFDIYNER